MPSFFLAFSGAIIGTLQPEHLNIFDAFTWHISHTLFKFPLVSLKEGRHHLTPILTPGVHTNMSIISLSPASRPRNPLTSPGRPSQTSANAHVTSRSHRTAHAQPARTDKRPYNPLAARPYACPSPARASLVCTPELGVPACYTYTTCDHAWTPAESASDAWHLGAVGASHSHSVGGHEHWATQYIAKKHPGTRWLVIGVVNKRKYNALGHTHSKFGRYE